MWNLRQNLESSGHQEKYKSHTSVGRKFAPVEGLSHDLVCTGSIYHVHFAWQVWHGQLSPRFKFNKLKKLFRGGNWPESCWQKDSRGKGFAVGRLKRHNFCPASALRNRCCIDTKRCSGGYTQPVQVDILSHRCCVCVDTKRDHGGQENNSRLCGIWGKIWRALGTKKNTKVTLRYGTGVALTLSAVQVDILSLFRWIYSATGVAFALTLRETMVDKRTIHVYVEFEAKFGELWAPRKIQKSHFSRKKVCACWRFESWLGLYRIDLSCPFCVAGVARSIITPF